ncbi:hypothetical protein U9M48_025798, partial [Paspalum notatum var. saurae]
MRWRRRRRMRMRWLGDGGEDAVARERRKGKGKEKLDNIGRSTIALLLLTEKSKVILIFFSTVAQLNRRFTKTTSCSAPSRLPMSTTSRRFSNSSSAFQFVG